MNGETHRRVLVVEDEPLISLDIQAVLSDAGFDVVGSAATVIEAMELAHEVEFEGAVVDMNLNGDLTSPVVQKLLDQSVPVVLLTGYSSKALAEPFCRCPLINKPYDSSHLVDTLQFAMGRAHASKPQRAELTPTLRNS
jgi:AmiR/NasT family two-component response regulator